MEQCGATRFPDTKAVHVIFRLQTAFELGTPLLSRDKFIAQLQTVDSRTSYIYIYIINTVHIPSS
jgi:hypothetical protein